MFLNLPVNREMRALISWFSNDGKSKGRIWHNTEFLKVKLSQSKYLVRTFMWTSMSQNLFLEMWMLLFFTLINFDFHKYRCMYFIDRMANIFHFDFYTRNYDKIIAYIIKVLLCVAHEMHYDRTTIWLIICDEYNFENALQLTHNIGVLYSNKNSFIISIPLVRVYVRLGARSTIWGTISYMYSRKFYNIGDR